MKSSTYPWISRNAFYRVEESLLTAMTQLLVKVHVIFNYPVIHILGAPFARVREEKGSSVHLSVSSSCPSPPLLILSLPPSPPPALLVSTLRFPFRGSQNTGSPSFLFVSVAKRREGTIVTKRPLLRSGRLTDMKRGSKSGHFCLSRETHEPPACGRRGWQQ